MKNLKPNQVILDGYTITEHPILFQTEMVQAIDQDRKTQTRRIIKDELLQANTKPEDEEFLLVTLLDCKYGKPGDLLWVKETMIKNNNSQTYWPVADGYIKTADYEKKISSIHMPKAYARFWLMIEEIKSDRVQNISEDDAKAEGVNRWTETRLKSQPKRYKVYTNFDSEALYSSTAKHSFETLWEFINGQESWQQNPWVWVIKFRVLSKTGRPSDDVILHHFNQITK